MNAADTNASESGQLPQNPYENHAAAAAGSSEQLLLDAQRAYNESNQSIITREARSGLPHSQGGYGQA